MAVTDKKIRLGDVLVQDGVISEQQLQSALDEQKSTGKRLGEVLIDSHFITQKQLVHALETHLGIGSINLKTVTLDPKSVHLIPENLARRHIVLPVHIANGELVLAMADPLNQAAIQDVRLMVHMPVRAVLASADDIEVYLNRIFSQVMVNKAASDFAQSRQNILDGIEDIGGEMDVNAAPVVRLVNSVFESAIRSGASDIHIEAAHDRMRIRIRIDGVLQQALETDIRSHGTVVSRIKVMAGLNIAEKRVPQDGRILHQIDGRDVDVRVSTMPTSHGEKVVMRILDRLSFSIGKINLGLYPDDAARFDRMLAYPYGIILVTGPTGSGKTTSLYSMLSELNDNHKNIMTIEDPVEYDIKGINQSQINIRAGLDYATGLRAFLRQDPDIIMVGEIRDSETADIAVRAALTGHLVLSTLHTNNAPSAIARLVDMGVEPYLISSALAGVVAQRLVRRICDECKESYLADEREKLLLDVPDWQEQTLWRGKGCEYCKGTGYKGRVGAFEIMEVNKKMRYLIDKQASTDEIADEALSQGMNFLKQDAVRKVLDGLTTVEEMLRATYTN